MPCESHQVAGRHLEKGRLAVACQGEKERVVFLGMGHLGEKEIGVDLPEILDFGVHLGAQIRGEEREGREEGRVVQQGSGCVSANNKSK